jgi:hypothetical protein
MEGLLKNDILPAIVHTIAKFDEILFYQIAILKYNPESLSQSLELN